KKITNSTLTCLILLGISNLPFTVLPTVANPSIIAQSNPLKDTLIIPGVRIGPVNKKTTKQDLIKIFGKSKLKDIKISGPEGIGEFFATRVNLGAKRSFTVVWSNKNAIKPLDVRDLGTDWQTPEGIKLGTKFNKLRQILGEFQLTGLGWDYGGIVSFEKTKLASYYGKIIVSVETDPEAGSKYPKNYQAVSGDRHFSSTSPHWQKLGVRIVSIVVFLNPEE
ncbi:MAG TPA: hypothetical protein V6C58_26710, partial [Allocoleopsis sp.]